MVDLTAIVIKQALKDEESFEVAFETWKAFSSQRIYEEIRENFIKKLIEKINNELIISYPSLKNCINWIDESSSAQIHIGLFIQLTNWKNKYKFGIYDEDNDRLYFSIACQNENEEICQGIHTQIKNLLNEGYDYPNHWWSRVKTPYNRWESNFEGLKQFAFCDEIALKYFVAKFCSFIALINNEIINIE